MTRLMATLLYGAGLRLMECARLRVKDVDFSASQLAIRSGKGDRDRMAILPATAREALADQLGRVREQHAADLAHGAGWVKLPLALHRKYPNAGRELAWQRAFPATRTYFHRETRQRRRHHLHETVLQRAVRDAFGGRALPSASPPTHSATPSRPTFSKTVRTSVPSRICSGTAPSPRR